MRNDLDKYQREKTKMNEITATAKYLYKLYQVFKEKGFDNMIMHELTATGISFIQRLENLDIYLEDRTRFKNSSAEQSFQRFKKSWSGYDLSERAQENYNSWVEDQKRRYRQQVREPAKMRRDERLDWICNIEDDEVRVMMDLLKND